MSELKRCPFCGRDMYIRRARNKLGRIDRYEIRHKGEDIDCVLYQTWVYNTAEEAEKAWNHRAIEPVPTLKINTKGRKS